MLSCSSPINTSRLSHSQKLATEAQMEAVANGGRAEV